MKERSIEKGNTTSRRVSCESNREGDNMATLDEEIAALRSSLAKVRKRMKRKDEDISKLGGLVSRLCDSIVRAMLAQQKLAVEDEDFGWLRSEFQRMLRELGYGERREADGSQDNEPVTAE